MKKLLTSLALAVLLISPQVQAGMIGSGENVPDTERERVRELVGRPELAQQLEQMGIALVAYSPLGRGFLAGRFRTLEDLAPDDWRRNNPRFQGENFEKNVALADHLREMAVQHHCTPAQLALAWLLNRHDNVVPIPGTSSINRLVENVAAIDIELSEADLDRIEQLSPQNAVAGTRYGREMMGLVNR